MKWSAFKWGNTLKVLTANFLNGFGRHEKLKLDLKSTSSCIIFLVKCGYNTEKIVYLVLFQLKNQLIQQTY